MNKKITELEFKNTYEVLTDGPKTINSGMVNVMFDKYEVLLKHRVTNEVFNTSIFVSDISIAESFAISQYCE